jgi:hypothetical protein
LVAPHCIEAPERPVNRTNGSDKPNILWSTRTSTHEEVE